MSLLNAFSKLTLKVPMRSITISQLLCAEPLKKKKKIDPQIIKQREERRKKKLEKQIRRLKKNIRQLKPVEELITSIELQSENNKRARTLMSTSTFEFERSFVLKKEWSRYLHLKKTLNFQIIKNLLLCQQKSLIELHQASEALYEKAVRLDFSLLPVIARGPVKTPGILDYIYPDGDYQKEINSWE